MEGCTSRRLRLEPERSERCHLRVQTATDAGSWGGEATVLAPLSRYPGARREAEARAQLGAVWRGTGMHGGTCGAAIRHRTSLVK
eukprot:scaffold83254_cov42-Phaeocystis_antarctica.AAC.1